MNTNMVLPHEDLDDWSNRMDVGLNYSCYLP